MSWIQRQQNKRPRVLLYILLSVVGVMAIYTYGCQAVTSLECKITKHTGNRCLVEYPREINGCRILYSDLVDFPPNYVLSFKGHKKYTEDDCTVEMRVTQKEYEDYINSR